MAKLNEKQKRFVREYLKDFDGKNAAIRAGYSPKTAKQQAYRLLTNVYLKKYFQKRYEKEDQKLEEEYNVTRAWIRKRLVAIANGDIGDFANWDENEVTLIPKRDLKITRAIKKLKTKKRIEHTNDGAPIVTTENEVVLKDDIKALELLGRSIGMFSDTNDGEQEKSGRDSVTKRVLELARKYRERTRQDGSDKDSVSE